jgi:hypothetical protein
VPYRQHRPETGSRQYPTVTPIASTGVQVQETRNNPGNYRQMGSQKFHSLRLKVPGNSICNTDVIGFRPLPFVRACVRARARMSVYTRSHVSVYRLRGFVRELRGFVFETPHKNPFIFNGLRGLGFMGFLTKSYTREKRRILCF